MSGPQLGELGRVFIKESIPMSDGATLAIPRGFRASGVKAGLKASGTLDLAVLATDEPSAAAGTFTTNRVCAAPVKWCREQLPSEEVRAVVINSGNANAATGATGLENAARTAAHAAALLGCRPEQVLVASTGVIGHQLPMDRIEAGIEQAVAGLSPNAVGFQDAAAAIMTTDTRPKIVSFRQTNAGRAVTLLGLAKGAAMIGPRMATMLGFLLTDAPVWANELQDILAAAVDRSFNCLSVEGHASTNDTVLLLSSTAGTEPILRGEELAAFAGMVRSACETLACAIAADGEGSTHFITIDVEGCSHFEDARAIARAVADSPLVKTAIHGADPNWGRIVSAAGYAGVSFREEELSLSINDVPVYEDGMPVPFDAANLSQSIKSERDVHLRLMLRCGSAAVRFWTCDLTAEYIRLNADYTT
ncbi:MAG: bifunctional glutamate N-acetyltransferase/amino-acid acetyltransferase ArgJ [Isosphaerales bacterium]